MLIYHFAALPQHSPQVDLFLDTLCARNKQRAANLNQSEETMSRMTASDVYLSRSFTQAQNLVPMIAHDLTLSDTLSQSRTQSPRAFWSEGERPERLWDNGNNGLHFPRKRGFRLYCACLRKETGEMIIGLL